MLKRRRVVAAFLAIAVALTIAVRVIQLDAQARRRDEDRIAAQEVQLADQQYALCLEAAHRYDAIAAVIDVASTVSPVTRERISAAQLAQLEAYYADFRARAVATLGARPPKCVRVAAG